MLIYLATSVAIALTAFLAGIVLAPHLRLHWATRHIASPYGFAFDPEGIIEYIASTNYSWRTMLAVVGSETAVYHGELERGFGRRYRIRWSPTIDELQFEDIRYLRLWRFTSNRCSRSTLNGFNPEEKRQITEAITCKMNS